MYTLRIMILTNKISTLRFRVRVQQKKKLSMRYD